MVIFDLNFFPARSAALKQNWLPYSVKRRWGDSSTVLLKSMAGGVEEDWRVGSSEIVEYSGTPKVKIVFCFGRTGERYIDQSE